MNCPPTHAELNRTVIDATPVDRSDDWWTGLVCDREHRTGEERLRLERYPPDGSKNRPTHSWRIRPEFWAAEREAVERFARVGGEPPSGALPIDDFYTPREHLPIRRDHTRRVELVLIENQWGQTSTRLYHWDPADGSTTQKWTVGKQWPRLSRLATRALEATQES